MKLQNLRLCLTFDDLLLVPQKSEVVPSEVKIGTQLCEGVYLPSPVLSAAMDTVTEKEMAIAMALEGGLGVIHKNMPAEEEAKQVRAVKDYVFDLTKYPNAAVDKEGKLLASAAVGVGQDSLERAALLVKAGIDLLIVDSAHGHSKNILQTVANLRKSFPKLPIIAGNVVTGEGALELIRAGATGVKVGIGAGSICTTRVVSGVGMPQATAIDDVVNSLKGTGHPVIADGGLKYSGDIVKALALGASAVMLGSMLSGTDEAPGEVFEECGKTYKTYVGMGSLAAMKSGSADRYFQNAADRKEKLVPEGIEAKVPYKGSLGTVLYQVLGGLRSGMGYCGARDLSELHEKAVFIRITTSGLIESHPHDVIQNVESPNYQK